MKSMEVFSELRKEGTCCCVMVRLQVSWLPAVRAVTQLRNRLVQVSDNKFLRIILILPLWHLLTTESCGVITYYICAQALQALLISSLSCCAGLKKSKHAMYQLILTFRLKASIFTACLSPDTLGVNDKVNDWDGDSRQMWAEQVINCDKW